MADEALRQFAVEVERPDRDIDLGRAALVMARSEDPDLDIARYLSRLDELAARSAVDPDGVRRGADPVAVLHRLREFLFAEVGFAGNRRDYFDPRNSLLNEVLDRRLGIPITLSLVLIEVGRRVGLDLHGIGLPGHFITGLGVGGDRILLDPFNRGRILTADSCQSVVTKAVGRPIPLRESHFARVGKRQFLARMLNNLRAVFWKREEWDKVVPVLDRLLVLAPEVASLARDRGTALARLGRPYQATLEWERYLLRCPEADDYEQVRAHLRQAREQLARLN